MWVTLPESKAEAKALVTIRKTLVTRDQLIWQIKEFHYRHSILSVIYHIRADAFRIFGL